MAVKGTPSVRLHKVSWGITSALRSAILEWLLILMLFIDAIFSYLVTKFARSFKLQILCLLCSRLDHVLGNENDGFCWDLMEEQAEYDGEALQKANDLLAEKEKGLQDLEAELELYRKKIGEVMLENMVEPTYDLKATRAEDLDASYVKNSAHSVTNKYNICDKIEETDMLIGDRSAVTAKSLLLEFENERVYIVQFLKNLEEKLHLLAMSLARVSFVYSSVCLSCLWTAHLQPLFSLFSDYQRLRALELNSWQLLRLVQVQLPGLSCGSDDQGSGISKCDGSVEEMFCCLYLNAAALHQSWKSKKVSRSNSRDDYGSTVLAYQHFLGSASEWLLGRATDWFTEISKIREKDGNDDLGQQWQCTGRQGVLPMKDAERTSSDRFKLGIRFLAPNPIQRWLLSCGSSISLTYIASERIIPGYGGGMSSAKAALESDTKVLAFEAGRKHKIRVNTLSAAYTLDEVDEKTKALRASANYTIGDDASTIDKFQALLYSAAIALKTFPNTTKYLRTIVSFVNDMYQILGGLIMMIYTEQLTYTSSKAVTNTVQVLFFEQARVAMAGGQVTELPNNIKALLPTHDDPSKPSTHTTVPAEDQWCLWP
ncbi:hypothetical protein F0562_023262 [Nyssa sinensis]|uniref:GTD-binding domain-containing protein n=1 Tax=Nyssa sinensis TaxID=561372 RepID=A0A5J5BIM3_9ASTE|nr:hypothetical protein F0562_023262 [Nyssa sinensis]